MIKVTAKIDHQNAFGEKYQKAKGDTYDAPANAIGALVAGGVIDAPEGYDAKTGTMKPVEAKAPAKA